MSQGKKDFYDYLHMSPLKIHVSFSLTSHNSRRDGGATRYVKLRDEGDIGM